MFLILEILVPLSLCIRMLYNMHIASILLITVIIISLILYWLLFMQNHIAITAHRNYNLFIFFVFFKEAPHILYIIWVYFKVKVQFSNSIYKISFLMMRSLKFMFCKTYIIKEWKKLMSQIMQIKPLRLKYT